MSHPNRDLKSFKPKKYKDPLEDTEEYKKAEREHDMKQFGFVANMGKINDNKE